MAVNELMALTDGAYADLWRYLAEMDWVAKVKAEWRSPSEPLPWLLVNARAAMPSDEGDDLWVRIHDVPKALEARTYAGDGRLVLEVIDPEARGGRIRVELDASQEPAPGAADPRSRPSSPSMSRRSAPCISARPRSATRPCDSAVSSTRPVRRTGSIGLMRTLDEPWCTTFF